MQQQAVSNDAVFSDEVRRGMVQRIMKVIKGPVMAAGRGEEFVTKYSYNIEKTALKSCKGNMADYERMVNEMIAKLVRNGSQHHHQQQQQAAPAMQSQMIQQQQQQQQQQQAPQQMMGMQQPSMPGVPQFNMAQYPGSQMAMTTPQVPVQQQQQQQQQQLVPQSAMYNATQMGQLNRPAQLQQQQHMQMQQPAMHMPLQQLGQPSGVQMQQQQHSAQTAMQGQPPTQQQQQQQQPHAPSTGGGGGVTTQESADPAFLDFLQELANQPTIQPQAAPAAAGPQHMAMQQQQQQPSQMTGYRAAPAQQTPPQGQAGLMQQHQSTVQQQTGPASGGFAAMMQQTVPQQQAAQQPQGNYTMSQQLQKLAPPQSQLPQGQQVHLPQQGMQQGVMFVPQQQMAGPAFMGMTGIPPTSAAMVPQQQATLGAFPGYATAQQQQHLQAQQQMAMQQQPAMAAIQQQQQQQQMGQAAMTAQQQQQARLPSGMMLSGPPSNGPTSGSAAANKGAVASAAAAHAAGLAAAQQRTMQSLQQQQQQQQPQTHNQQPQLIQPMAGQGTTTGAASAAAPAAGAAVGGVGPTSAAAAAAAARESADAAYAAQKQATYAHCQTLSPRTRAVKYYQQLDELRNKYAKDLHELHQLLNSQRVTAANKDKINSFMHRTTQLLQALNMPRPVNAETAHHISADNMLQLLSMKKQCESMVSQLRAIKDRKHSHTQHNAAGHPGEGSAQHLRQQQQQPGAMGPPAAAAGYAAAAATPDEVVSRPTAAPSPMNAGTAPSPAPGAAATAATPPIGAAASAAAQMIKPDMPPAPVLPAAVGSADMAKAVAAVTASGGAAAPAAGQAATGGKETPAAAAAGAVEHQTSAAARALANAAAAAAGVAADTPLGKLYAALATASDAQLAKATQQQAIALDWSRHPAHYGPLPSAADFAAAAAAAAGTLSETSDGSVVTVEDQVFDLGGEYNTPIESRTVCERFPDGYQRPQQRPAAAGMPASAGINSEVKAVVVAGRKRRRQEVQEMCKEVEGALEGLVRLQVLQEPDDGCSNIVAAGDAVAVCIECVAEAPQAAAATPPLAAAGVKQPGDEPAVKAAINSSSEAVSAWKRLRLLVPIDYPGQPPIAVFNTAFLVEANHVADGQDMVKSEARSNESVNQDAARQQQLAEEAWSELQAAICEAPGPDLRGIAEHWCQAVEVVTLQQSL